MTKIEYKDVIDKTEWPRGAWDSEPDKVQWPDETTSLPCLVVRGPGGSWCGYVGVAVGHPLYGVAYSDCYHGDKCPEPKGDGSYRYCDHRPESFLEVHGGITFAHHCSDLSKERWEEWRVHTIARRDEAKQYPQGEAAQITAANLHPGRLLLSSSLQDEDYKLAL